MPSASEREELCEAAGINQGGSPPLPPPPRINGVLPPPGGAPRGVGLCGEHRAVLKYGHIPSGTEQSSGMGGGGLREGPPPPLWVEGHNGVGGVWGPRAHPCLSLPPELSLAASHWVLFGPESDLSPPPERPLPPMPHPIVGGGRGWGSQRHSLGLWWRWVTVPMSPLPSQSREEGSHNPTFVLRYGDPSLLGVAECPPPPPPPSPPPSPIFPTPFNELSPN